MNKPLLIGGAWRLTEQFQEVRSPFTGEMLARVSAAERETVEEAIAIAAAAAIELRSLSR